ncbi:50S ribosomal protein L18e [Candidatus Woesearchaeota archaeon]|nr:50S ribosomal protein L18e [Candidatus Woesearchaeota archaeon]
MKRTGPMNHQVNVLLAELETKTRDSRFWRRVAEDIRKPTRQRRIVNVYKIDQFARDGETIVVPGKVLSVGEIHKKVNVAAMNFSMEAKRKILDAKGKVLSIQELLTSNPDGKKVRILG